MQSSSTTVGTGTHKGRLISDGYLVAFACVASLFFIWAIAHNFNDILIKQFQKAFDLTRMQSGLVQTAFFFGYFTMALPAGIAMRRVGYKNGILIGLALYAIGALLFYPAAEVQSFAFFLTALFIIAAGLTFLETAANPYIIVMGDPETSAQRLNFAQSFNGLGSFLAPFIGGALIFSGIEYSSEELAAMAPAAVDAYRATEARMVQAPYLVLAAATVLLGVVVFFIRFPEIQQEESASSRLFDTAVLKYRHLRWAVVTQFFYVGGQVGILSYFINFAQDLTDTPEKLAANFLGFSLIAFMVGRFVGTALMRYVAPQTLLAICATANVLLCTVAITAGGMTAVIALGATSFFKSIMFPTIFALGIKGLGEHAKIGSSLIVMAIIGGAVFPPIMGTIADATDSIQYAMMVPLACFLVVFHFARCGYVIKDERVSGATPPEIGHR